MQANNPKAEQFHISGYEHLKAIYYLKEAQARAPLQAASAYILPLMALQNAHLAIEAYLDQTGRSLDPDWNDVDWQAKSIQGQVAFVYEKMGQPLSFNSTVWKEVLGLFETARLIVGDLLEMRKLQRNEIPEEFKDIAVEYPIYRSQAIAEEAIDLLLELSDLHSPLKGNATLTN